MDRAALPHMIPVVVCPVYPAAGGICMTGTGWLHSMVAAQDLGVRCVTPLDCTNTQTAEGFLPTNVDWDPGALFLLQYISSRPTPPSMEA